MTLSLLRVTTAFRAVSFVQAAFKVVPWMSCRMRDEPIRPSDVPVDYRKLMYWGKVVVAALDVKEYPIQTLSSVDWRCRESR